ncbi:50S ribosomal protein L4 [Lactobacillus kefiranofaciens]|uniref:Large ribosomal subunit protein uL4 n=1 Tax=Lactobacillus kefiranofaciens TaxID=267818 RepID=A0AAX3UB74_9LACO|nr:50S ribosomal protein L4 [Lactobacillus kefiranofaciens]AEG41600.1 50S ribosomal protein L4 [Lactobacillus kefiranofaciens subsp. kefiranofaciens]KRL30372.1 50S ribosomal protein L4 [Lactobacillus kefiranofaciens subsp. kefirgranum DSM 10550 = JCM 8572]KRM22864.1 50S ribosomal protein L4 [Lactobacillus kefiranofaciens subsp. kefiranofaciens DSM 5016 = JCM 6985]MCJ2171641.1 50S ribosomal protein L4 [Lactobacillus kefiranofaciens]MCP9330363.1 50S ribosomal protein L4 [Lactobacillus kefiranofa
MANLKVMDQNGKDSGEVTLNDKVFGIEPNESVVFEAIIRQRAGKRQGTSKVKNRSAVRGGGKKPWRQKGTGRARQGSIRAPQWRGGGTVFGPTPRSYAYTMPRKQRRLAIKSVLSQKLIDNDLIVLDKLTMSASKTKDLVSMLSSLNVDGKVLVVSDDNNVQLSARNLAKVKAVPVNGLNVEDAVNYDKLILTQEAVKKIEEVLA